jgi:hypothetical protein
VFDREGEADEYLLTLDLIREGRFDIGAGSVITLREFLRRLTEGELSYIWSVPEPIRATRLPSLERWAEATFDLDAPMPTPRRISWSIYRNSA